jgi:ComF family protein
MNRQVNSRQRARKIADWGREYLRSLLRLLYPSDCRLCQGELGLDENLVCLQCWQEISALEPIYNYELVLVHEVPLYGIFSLAEHQGKAQELVHLIKYYNLELLIERWITKCADRLVFLKDLPIDFVVPVPLHHSRVRERGYDQALVIARALAKAIGKKVNNRIIKRNRSTQQMIDLTGSERYDNVQDAFRTYPSVQLNGAKVLLVDDVYTSGATASQSAKALYSVGALQVFVFSVTRALGKC